MRVTRVKFTVRQLLVAVAMLVLVVSNVVTSLEVWSLRETNLRLKDELGHLTISNDALVHVTKLGSSGI